MVFLCLWLEKSIRVYKKGEFITLNLTRFCLKLFLFLAAMAKTKSGKEEVQVLLCARTVGPRGRAASLAAQGVAEKSLRITTARTPAEAACHRRKPLQDPRTGCLVGTLSPGRIEDVMPIPSDLPRRREVAARERADIFVVAFL